MLTVGEIAQQLSCSEQNVRKLIRRGKLQAEKFGNTWVIPEEALNDLDKGEVEVAANKVPDRISKLKPKKRKLNVLSFFSGAMGLDQGLEEAGMNVLLACEIDEPCRETIVRNHSKIGLIGDIRNYSTTDILRYANAKSKEDIDVIVGGPPCQTFSTAGNRMGFEDDRGNTIIKLIEVITSIRPKYAVIENVRGLYSTPFTIDIKDELSSHFSFDFSKAPGSSLYYIVKMLELAGYKISFNLYNTANFGVPQIRERVVIICTLLDTPVPFLQPTHSNDPRFGLPHWKTLKDAVADLDMKKGDYIKFGEKRLRYIRMLKPGQNWRNLPADIQQEAMGNSFFLGGGKTGFYRRLSWDKPSPTLVTHPATPATELAHPKENRPLTIQEYKRIQQFPDEWVIEGNITDQYKQIGNAVPAGLGQAIAKAILNHYKGKTLKVLSNFPYSRYKNTGSHVWLKQFEQKFVKLNVPKPLEFDF